MAHLLKSLNLVAGHFGQAAKALASWWGAMSADEQRQARQRALGVAACAAVFAFAGPLVAHRFDIQKSDEAWRADTSVLAHQLAASIPTVRTETAAPAAALTGVRLVNAAYTVSPPAARTDNAAPRPASTGSDNDVLARLTTFNMHRLDIAEREQGELDCLAKAVYYEARSEPLRGQMAVAEVVMNRVNDSRFPKTICGVVYQGQTREVGCQFTFTCDGSLHLRPQGAAWDRARNVALHVAMGLNKPVTNHATHYHTDYVSPYWSAGLVETAEVGQHIFYRFPNTGAEWAHARLALGLHTMDGAPLSADELAAQSLAMLAAEDTAPAPAVTQAPVTTASQPAASESPAAVAAVPVSAAAVASDAPPNLILASATGKGL